MKFGEEKEREMCIFIVITKLFIYIKGVKRKRERGIEIEKESYEQDLFFTFECLFCTVFVFNSSLG